MKPIYDEQTAAAMAAGGYNMDLATTLRGDQVRAESSNKVNGGSGLVGSASNVTEATLSAYRKTMDGRFTSTITMPTGR